MRRILALSLAVPLVLASGCGIYFGNDDDDDWDECPPYGAIDPGAPLEIRNPYTGQCEYYGGGDWCDPLCGPCTADGAAEAPLPSWGFCDSFCSGLDEASCLVNPGCRGGYIETCAPNDPSCDLSADRVFWECWQTDFQGPQQAEDCASITDAWQCSIYDNCIAVHDDDCDATPNADPIDGLGIACGLGDFIACQPEPVGCYANSECGEGLRCNAAELCLPPPGCGTTDSNGLIDCDAACYGYCVADETPPCGTLDENTCVARADCSPFYEGVNCDCDANGNCVCDEWVFDACMDTE